MDEVASSPPKLGSFLPLLFFIRWQTGQTGQFRLTPISQTAREESLSEDAPFPFAPFLPKKKKDIGSHLLSFFFRGGAFKGKRERGSTTTRRRKLLIFPSFSFFFPFRMGFFPWHVPLLSLFSSFFLPRLCSFDSDISLLPTRSNLTAHNTTQIT